MEEKVRTADEELKRLTKVDKEENMWL